MQIVFLGDALHEMPNYIFWEKKRTVINLSCAEFVQWVVKVKVYSEQPKQNKSQQKYQTTYFRKANTCSAKVFILVLLL